MRARRNLATGALACAALLVLSAVGASPHGAQRTAFAQEAAEEPTDPFSEEVKAFLAEQDGWLDAGKLAELLKQSELRAQDGTPDSYYLLGRAHGMLATVHRTASDTVLYQKHLELAREAFGTSQEKGGLLYAPAYVGLARCGWIDGDLDQAAYHLERALRVDPHFRMAVLEIAQVHWNRDLRSDAENVLHRFLTDHPQDGEARLLLGRMKMARKRWAEARSEFQVVLQRDPENATARKLLGQALQFLQEHADAAAELERLREQTPQDPEVYRMLYQSYKQLGDLAAATRVLEALVVELPGTEEAARATVTLEEIAADPNYFARENLPTRDLLLRELESPDPLVVRRALGHMHELDWARLPAAVYKLLDPDRGRPDTRLAALRLVRKVGNDRALPLLEELVYHPKFADPEIEVRREAARAIADLETDATVLILWRLLADADVELREAGVQGIAARTGRYFRTRLADPTSAADWPAELERYRHWWNTTSASIAKRRAVKAMGSYFDRRSASRRRIGLYVLEAMRDSNERTWREGYALFRKLSFRTFGHALGTVEKDVRDQVTAEAEQWFRENVGATDAEEPVRESAGADDEAGKDE